MFFLSISLFTFIYVSGKDEHFKRSKLLSQLSWIVCNSGLNV